MFNYRKLQQYLIVGLLLLLAGCSKPVMDDEGRTLPVAGQAARLIDKNGWIIATESSIAVLVSSAQTAATPPDWLHPDQLAQWQQMADAAMAQTAERLRQEGKLIQVPTGTKVRILGYYNGDPNDIKTHTPHDKAAAWAKVEVLEGEAAHKTGFTTAEGVGD